MAEWMINGQESADDGPGEDGEAVYEKSMCNGGSNL